MERLVFPAFTKASWHFQGPTDKAFAVAPMQLSTLSKAMKRDGAIASKVPAKAWPREEMLEDQKGHIRAQERGR